MVEQRKHWVEWNSHLASGALEQLKAEAFLSVQREAQCSPHRLAVRPSVQGCWENGQQLHPHFPPLFLSFKSFDQSITHTLDSVPLMSQSPQKQPLQSWVLESENPELQWPSCHLLAVIFLNLICLIKRVTISSTSCENSVRCMVYCSS